MWCDISISFGLDEVLNWVLHDIRTALGNRVEEVHMHDSFVWQSLTPSGHSQDETPDGPCI